MKVRVSHIEWESYEGEEDEEPECSCPTTVELELGIPPGTDDDVLGLIYGMKLIEKFVMTH